MIYYICATDSDIPPFMWVAPDGKCLPVDHTGHMDVAIDEVFNLYSIGEISEEETLQNPEKTLEDRGWVRVNFLGYQMGQGKHLSDAQLPIILEHYDQYQNTHISSGYQSLWLSKQLLDNTLQNIL